MYLIVIAWTYVSLMAALAQAGSPAGTLLGAVVTFALYGLLPMGIVVYILGTPARKRAIRARAATAQASMQASTPASAAPDAGSKAPAAAQGSAVAPVRKEA